MRRQRRRAHRAERVRKDGRQVFTIIESERATRAEKRAAKAARYVADLRTEADNLEHRAGQEGIDGRDRAAHQAKAAALRAEADAIDPREPVPAESVPA